MAGGMGRHPKLLHRVPEPSASSGWSERGSWSMASICFVFSFFSFFLHPFWKFSRTLRIDPMISCPTGWSQLFSVSLTLHKIVGLGACTETTPSEYSSQSLGHQNPESWLLQSEITRVENVIIAVTWLLLY